MVSMNILNEAEIISNIQLRYQKHQLIFTYIGPTLLVINPYKKIDSLFKDENLLYYLQSV